MTLACWWAALHCGMPHGHRMRNASAHCTDTNCVRILTADSWPTRHASSVNEEIPKTPRVPEYFLDAEMGMLEAMWRMDHAPEADRSIDSTAQFEGERSNPGPEIEDQ